MRYFKAALLLIFFLITHGVQAQSNPIIEIVLSQPTAKLGDIVKADVYIRSATNLGGADIGIKVDETCLRITKFQAGTFIASTGETGGFSPFSEQHDHDTRFAAAITDRSKYANGDGLFYSVDLQVTCENGVAPLTVVFGELSGYKDPKAATIEFVAYTLTAKTASAINTQLIIGSPAVIPTLFNEPPSNIQPATSGQGTGTPANNGLVPTTAVVGQVPVASQPPVVLIAVVCLSGIGLLILIVAFIILRRRKDEDEEVEAEA